MSAVLAVVRLGPPPWPTLDPFLFCVHHLDHYPAGNEAMGPAASLAGREIGMDFAGKDGWRMYHGDVIPGFPRHPHRGFETVTLARQGFIDHSDSLGATARFGDGDVQWMTAGRGVIHSEIPQQEEGVMEGFQLWLNLPAQDKMSAPWYRDFAAGELPRFTTSAGVEATVIAGESHGVTGAVTRTVTAPLYLDLHLPAGSSFAQPLAADHNVFVYVYRGQVKLGEVAVPVRNMAILANAADRDGVRIEATEDARVLLIAGRPLGEPIAQYGPFVMNSEQEIYQAVADYRAGRLAA